MTEEMAEEQTTPVPEEHIEGQEEATPVADYVSEEGISCKLDIFEPKIASSDPTLILFLGKEIEGADEIVQAVLDRQDNLDVNAGVLDLADETCQDLSDKYSIDRDATQLVLFKNSEKRGAVSLSAKDAQEQMDKMAEIIGQVRETAP